MGNVIAVVEFYHVTNLCAAICTAIVCGLAGGAVVVGCAAHKIGGSQL
jgi:hypothetical protein